VIPVAQPVTDQRYQVELLGELFRKAIEPLVRRLDRLEQALGERDGVEKLRDQVAVLEGDLASQRRRYDELNRRYQDLLDQWQRKGREGAVSSTASGPGHDELKQDFEHFKAQRLVKLCRDLLPPGRSAQERRSALARLQAEVTEVVLVRAETLLASGTGPEEVASDVLRQLQAALGQRLLTPQPAKAVIEEAIKLLSSLRFARAPGRLLVAREGVMYDPREHEVYGGCPCEEGGLVEHTVYPGYAIDSPTRVLVKADVWIMPLLEARPCKEVPGSVVPSE
jgi:hypothetical protein